MTRLKEREESGAKFGGEFEGKRLRAKYGQTRKFLRLVGCQDTGRSRLSLENCLRLIRTGKSQYRWNACMKKNMHLPLPEMLILNTVITWNSVCCT